MLSWYTCCSFSVSGFQMIQALTELVWLISGLFQLSSYKAFLS